MRRADDLSILTDVLEIERLPPDVREAFEDMQRNLTTGGRFCLSDKQREYVRKMLGVPGYENLVSRGIVARTVVHRHKELAPCGPTCPAWKPPALAHLPKRPPGGRA